MDLRKELIETLRRERSGKQIALAEKAVIGHYDSPENRTVLFVSTYDVETGISLGQKITYNNDNNQKGKLQ